MCFNQVFPSPNFSDSFQIFIHPTLCLFLYIFKINKQKGNTEKQKQETHEMPHKKIKCINKNKKAKYQEDRKCFKKGIHCKKTTEILLS